VGIGLAGTVESLAFDGHVGVEVNACRCLCFVAEPQSDDSGIDAGLEETHRCGVSQGMYGDVLAGEVRADGRGLGQMEGEPSLNGVGGKRETARIREKGLAGTGRPLLKVCPQQGCCG
jgi:hypothetical protein